MNKVVFIGFDAGNKYLIQDWANAGILPTFRSLLAKGLKGDTMGPDQFTGAIWPSFMTGTTPARHGVHTWLQLKPGSYEFYRSYAGEHIKREPFWNYLGRAGHRVTVLDIPLSSVTQNLNGVQLVEWGTHDNHSGFATWPPQLARDIVSRFGKHPLTAICNADRTTTEYESFRDDLLRAIGTKVQITRHLLHQSEWKFFAQVFTEGHCAGHQCWHFHDTTHPRHDAEQAAVVGNPIKDVYVAIDAAIGEVLKELDDETMVVVLVSHGMGYRYGAHFLLDQILLRLGVSAPAATQAPAGVEVPRIRDRVDPFLTWGWQHTPDALRKLLQPIRKPLRTWMMPEEKEHAPMLDPAGGKCFSVENSYQRGGIRVNLVGREPAGKVKPGTELDAFCAALARDLMDIIDLDTGKRVIERVQRTDELYDGEHRDHLPDLVVEWAGGAPISKIRLGSPKIGEIAGEYSFCRTGDHFAGGMFVALGPGIKPGTLDRTIDITDFAPTFARMFDVELPDVDGKPIGEILTPETASA